MNLLDHEKTTEKKERDQTYLEMLAGKIRTTGRKETISEEDLQIIYRTIDQADLPKTRLQNIMLIFGATLRKRTEPNLKTLGGCLILAAKAELPSPVSPLEHSLPDLSTQHEETVEDDDGVFINSMVIGEGTMAEDKKQGAELSPPTDESNLAHSGVFSKENEDEIEEESEEKIEKETTEIKLPTLEDQRLSTIKKLQNRESLTHDERVRSGKTISIVDIRKGHAPEIGTNALKIRNHQIDGLSQLHIEVLNALEELKDLVNRLLKTVYQNLGNNWVPEQGEKISNDFFTENQQRLAAIFAMDQAISQLEDDCREITEMQSEMDFLGETIEDTSAYYEDLEKTTDEEELFVGLLRQSILTQMRTLLYHDEEVQERLEHVREDFVEIFQGFWKLEVKIPDPWK